jgi:pimeloyl-ACP methyl ester carboxylesterase
MAQVHANGIDIEYESHGDRAAETVLLIMGYGMQLIHWTDEFVDQLVNRGYRVLRFDNRDTGLSTRFDGARVPNALLQLMLGQVNVRLRTPYTLDDMARDAIGLLDALEIERAHVVGASMGGMIAQLIAGHYPQRTLSLTSIMSTTGHPSLPRGKPAAMRALTAVAPDPEADLEAFLAHRLRILRAIGSPDYPTPEDVVIERSLRAFKRAYYPEGLQRQMAAILAAPHRRELLRRVTVPASIIHGEVDPLIRVQCGRDTARHLVGGEMITIPGMGHDLPAPLLPAIVDGIERAAARSRAQVT